MRHPPPHVATVPALISIIIPIYNVEKYIADCLESCIHQSYSAIEIICIDDGSTDSSRVIVEHYMQKDSRIQLYTQENKGVSSARNRGLQYARAPYIMFCDPDDYYALTAVEIMYKAMHTYDVDIVIGQIHTVNECKSLIRQSKASAPITPDKEGKFPIHEQEFRISWSQCAKLFKHQIITEHALSFPEDILYGEDLQFFYTYFALCHYLYYISSPVYYYRQHNTSITHISDRADILPMLAKHPIQAIENVVYFIRDLGTLNKYIEPLCELYVKQFRFSSGKAPESEILTLHKESTAFLDSIHEYLLCLRTPATFQEISAIQQGYTMYTLFRENNRLQKEVVSLYKKSLLFKIRYAKYWFLSKLPVTRQEQYHKKYLRLQQHGK